MRYPFFRIAEYSKFLAQIADCLQSKSKKETFQNVAVSWDSLKIHVKSTHKLADNTRLFWESTTPRLVESMRTPQRRVLIDSKSQHISLTGSSRFSHHFFILFEDVFLHLNNANSTAFKLETIWIESNNDSQNNFVIITPEDRLELFAPSSKQKTEWVVLLNTAISRVLTSIKAIPSYHGNGERFTPPLVRHASYTFVKSGIYKDATYSGLWLTGKPHGQGEITWADGSTYVGHFQKGLSHGEGRFTLTKTNGQETQVGQWKDGKLNGLATVTYANGDMYQGYFREGQRFGHGLYQIGKHMSSSASVYVGEWLSNARHGYGVQDDILKGEKYMGMWVDDFRHGDGLIVTLDGMYFEGTFHQNELRGFGVMISDDHMLYEGDFHNITQLAGKGTLVLPSGDKLEGQFHGSLNEGLKVNGTFVKSVSSPQHERKVIGSSLPKSRNFGRLCVSADDKWTDVFSHVFSSLGQTSLLKGEGRIDTDKAWELVAVALTAGRHSVQEQSSVSPSKAKVQNGVLNDLEKIPTARQSLNTEYLQEISDYISKAFDTTFHPLGQLMETLVHVFRSSYIGVGAHPRLLHHALQEVTSYIKRLYRVVRVLFPALPANRGPLSVYPPAHTTEPLSDEVFVEGLELDDPNKTVLTASGLLYPILLPKIYPPLIDLYVLYDEKSDDLYWERVTKLNRQSDIGLMAYLGVDERFWLLNERLQKDKNLKLSDIREECYGEAVEKLQQLSTAFSPAEKLSVIERSFDFITQSVTNTLDKDHVWCMDELFPIFQFVVVRAKIQHLGAEIHLVEDLMEPHMEHGEFGIMFTMLKASYFQIQNEKIPHS